MHVMISVLEGFLKNYISHIVLSGVFIGSAALQLPKLVFLH